MAVSKAEHKSTPEPGAGEFPMSIDEFCRLQSAQDRRVEMLSAFAADLYRQGIKRATATEYRALLAQFAVRAA